MADKPSSDRPGARAPAREQGAGGIEARDSDATLVPDCADSDAGSCVAEPAPVERPPATSLGPIRSLRFAADDATPQIDTKKPSAMRLNALAVPGSPATSSGPAQTARSAEGDTSKLFLFARRIRRLGAVAIGFVVVGGLTVAALLALRAIEPDSPHSVPAVQGELMAQPDQHARELEQSRGSSALGASALSAAVASEPGAVGEPETPRHSRSKPAGAGDSIAGSARATSPRAAEAPALARLRTGSTRGSGAASRSAAPPPSARTRTDRATVPGSRPAASAGAASEPSQIPDELYF